MSEEEMVSQSSENNLKEGNTTRRIRTWEGRKAVHIWFLDNVNLRC